MSLFGVVYLYIGIVVVVLISAAVYVRRGRYF